MAAFRRAALAGLLGLGLLPAGCTGIRILIDDAPIGGQPMATAAGDRAPVAGAAGRPERRLVVAVLPLTVDRELARQGIHPDPRALQRQLIAELAEDPSLRLLDAAACDPDALGVPLVAGRRFFSPDELSRLRSRSGADVVVAPRLEWTKGGDHGICSISSLIAAMHAPGASTTLSVPDVRADTAAIERALPTAFRFVRTQLAELRSHAEWRSQAPYFKAARPLPGR